MSEENDGFAKASPDFKEIKEEKAHASEEDKDKAIADNKLNK